jgi:predicted nuclease of predicted toxin-antitoxin system
MNFYLDDSLASKSLEALLVKSGHRALRSQQANLLGANDARHLGYAIGAHLITLTSDWEDFEDLHQLILIAGGTHPGIITVRFENDKTRDMRPAQIVRALSRLERSGIPLSSELIILNHWR